MAFLKLSIRFSAGDDLDHIFASSSGDCRVQNVICRMNDWHLDVTPIISTRLRPLYVKHGREESCGRHGPTL